MLDYERFSATQDIDAELRYSYMHLQSFGSSAEVVQGEASAENLGLYLRRRAPIADWTLLGNPLRYVLEGAHTEFLGEQRGALGFTGLTSLGLASSWTAVNTRSLSPAPDWWRAICSAITPRAMA